MQTLEGKTVREIALELPQTIRVFEEFKIDYCCGGRKLLSDACEKAGVDPVKVMARIEALPEAETSRDDGKDKSSLPELMDHIVDKHHVFTRDELANLTPLMEKVARVHGDNHPEIIELKSVFEEMTDDLVPHMMKEETVLFPYIDRMARNIEKGLLPPIPPFGTVGHPIQMMSLEHEAVGDLLAKMRQLTNDYVTPPDACPSFTGLYYRLAELERDLHVHIHLENNVLFPNAVEMEANASALAVQR